MSSRHKVFVSYHRDNDQRDKDNFEQMFAYHLNILVSKSVQIGDIDDNLTDERTWQLIRDEYIKDSTVTVVLIGAET